MKNVSLIPILTVALVAVSCFKFNDGYDFRDKGVDLTVGLLQGASLPVGSTELVRFSDIADISESENVEVRENGDCWFVLTGAEPASYLYRIPSIVIDPLESEPIVVHAPAGEYPGGSNNPFQAYGLEQSIEIDQYGIDESVVDISSATVDSDLSLVFTVSKQNCKLVIKTGTVINIPRWMFIDEDSIDKEHYSLPNPHAIMFTSEMKSEPGLPLTIEGKIDSLDFSLLPEGCGIVEPGHIVISDKMTVDGNFDMEVFEAFSAAEPEKVMEIAVELGSLEVISARCCLRPTFNLEVKPYNVGIVSGALSNPANNFDFRDVYFHMGIGSSLPMDADLTASISTEIGEETIGTVEVGGQQRPFVVPAMKQTDYCLSQDGSGGSDQETGYAVPGMKTLWTRIPDYIIYNNVTLKGAEGYFDVRMGAECPFNFDYRIEAPMAFNRDLYVRIETGLPLGLKAGKVGISDLLVEGMLHNSIPLDLALTGELLDSLGTKVEDVDVDIDVRTQPGLPGKEDVSPIRIQIRSDHPVEVMDSLAIVVTATGVTGEFEGVCLNTGHGLKISDISAHTDGGVIVDLGKHDDMDPEEEEEEL